MAELLAPAGNPEALDAAINEGADAVYLGLKSFNARLRSSNFAWSQFEATVDTLHKKGKKIFVTVNTVIQESETERMYRFLAYLDKIGPDGLIVQDFGVLNLARTYFPKLRIHASTQMNIASARAANTMSRSGVSRVVLARELGIAEIQDIKARSSCELEVFVHGALCVSESGLCLFSSYLGGKSANRGMCSQACRRLYSAEVSGGNQQGYFFSPHDLQLIDHIPDLVQAGVHSFKIEGRMKSADYVGTVVSAYRYMLDHWEEDRKGSAENAKRILANDFARAKTAYWYTSPKAENILNPDQDGGTGIYLGKIDKIRTEEDGRYATIKGGSYDPDLGDSVRLHKKDDSVRESHKIREIHEEGNLRWVDVPAGFGSGDSVYLIQTKNMSRHYPHVLPKILSAYRSQPGDEKIPPLKLDAPPAKPHKGDVVDFPEGLYTQVSTIEDLYAILADRPERAILELNRNTIPSLLGLPGPDGQANTRVLPFSKRELILSIDPYLPQAMEDGLSTSLDDLIENGYSQFIVNNPGHLGMLRNRGLKLIAGPYLYAFNRWAADWLNKQGLSTIITPLENSRENLDATFDEAARSQVLVTVFAYPALFRMRFKLPENYNFTFFSDRQSGVFKALSTEDGSFVLPENPFSIADKSAFLKKTGYNRHLIDLSKTRVNKQEFRMIMDSYRKGAALPDISRFNWKEGFYNPDQMEEFKQMTERAKFRRVEKKDSDKPGKNVTWKPKKNGITGRSGTTGRTAGEGRISKDEKPGATRKSVSGKTTVRKTSAGRKPKEGRTSDAKKRREPSKTEIK